MVALRFNSPLAHAAPGISREPGPGGQETGGPVLVVSGGARRPERSVGTSAAQPSPGPATSASGLPTDLAAGAPGPDRPSARPAPGAVATIADPAASRTDEDMTHGLATKHRTAHLRRQVRGPELAPETLGAGTPAAADPATPGVGADAGGVVVRLPSFRPRRDGATRVGAVVPLDADHRASLPKPLAALGWDRTPTWSSRSTATAPWSAPASRARHSRGWSACASPAAG